MFLIDDAACVRKEVWVDIRRSLVSVVKYATLHDKDGVDLAFVHTGNKYPGITSPDEFMARFDNERVFGGDESTLSYCLDRHLAAYKKKYLDQAKQQRNQKPLNLIVLTSGDPGENDDFEEVVTQYATEFEKLGAPIKQLGIQFVLVHSQPEHQERFQHLDDISLWKPNVRDIVDTTTYNPAMDEENPEIHLKILCGAVNRRIGTGCHLSGEHPPSPALYKNTPVSTPVFHSSETPAQSDVSYTAPGPARFLAPNFSKTPCPTRRSTPIIPRTQSLTMIV
ncbi:hypothetical protein BDD12DRAFT_743919 [Trichophaea hybrida]|nr:hypothetical protein BDD12DRAFT_743919 [Trichophaea hybrida]